MMDFDSRYKPARSVSGGLGSGRRLGRVLLRGPELCPVCRGVFQSLYPLRHCLDHEDLEPTSMVGRKSKKDESGD